MEPPRAIDDPRDLAHPSLHLERVIAEQLEDAASPAGSWARASQILQWAMELASEASNGHLVLRTTPHQCETAARTGWL